MAIEQAEKDPNLPSSASNVLSGVLAIYNSPFFDRVAGQVKMPAGLVNVRVSLLHETSHVLEPLLHPY